MPTGNFPFDIEDIATLLKLNLRHRNSKSMDVDCPLCGKKGKMNLNTDKNVFRCNYCGEYGGMVTLYAKVYNLDNGDAYREICDSLKTSPKAAPINKVPKDMPTVPVASLDIRDQTYRMLFSMLTLSKTHKENLISRGLDEASIYKYGYKSTPAFGYSNIIRALINSGCIVEGVPGFWKKDGEWEVNFSSPCSGIIIPVVSLDGHIVAAQIRLDRPINDRKYIWFSSVDKNCGTSAGSPAHFIGDPTSETVYVTEGALKATIAHSLSGKTFAAVAGVSQYSSLDKMLGELKANGVKNIIETYDMDKCTNEHVENGCQKLLELCGKYGFTTHRLSWDPCYKGIDDYLWAKKKAHL